jgi:hypothetical protein
LDLTFEELGAIAASSLPLIDDAGWIVRRKHRVEFLEPGLVRHYVTLDLDVPQTAYESTAGKWLPITTLPKAPGTLFRFDFSTDGRTVPLRTRAENSEISLAILLAEANRTLPGVIAHLNVADPTQLTTDIRDELLVLAADDSQAGQSIIKNEWTPTKASTFFGQLFAKAHPTTELVADDLSRLRSAIRTDHKRLWWLINTVAHSSFLVVPLALAAGERIIVKLAYDEVIVDVLGGWTWSVRRTIRAATYRSGFRSLPITFYVPWASARSFHFEAHVPSGLSVARAGEAATGEFESDHVRHLHIYCPPGVVDRVQRIAVNYRLRADDYGLAAYGGAMILTALLALAAWHPGYLWTTTDDPLTGREQITSLGAAPSILLLVPGLIAAYVARRTHPVAQRLAGLARFSLAVVAVAAFVVACRIAVIGNPATANQYGLRWHWLVPSAILTACASVVLVGRRLSTSFALMVSPLTTKGRAWWAARTLPPP